MKTFITKVLPFVFFVAIMVLIFFLSTKLAEKHNRDIHKNHVFTLGDYAVKPNEQTMEGLARVFEITDSAESAQAIAKILAKGESLDRTKYHLFKDTKEYVKGRNYFLVVRVKYGTTQTYNVVEYKNAFSVDPVGVESLIDPEDKVEYVTKPKS